MPVQPTRDPEFYSAFQPAFLQLHHIHSTACLLYLHRHFVLDSAAPWVISADTLELNFCCCECDTILVVIVNASVTQMCWILYQSSISVLKPLGSLFLLLLSATCNWIWVINNQNVIYSLDFMRRLHGTKAFRLLCSTGMNFPVTEPTHHSIEAVSFPLHSLSPSENAFILYFLIFHLVWRDGKTLLVLITPEDQSVNWNCMTLEDTVPWYFLTWQSRCWCRDGTFN